MGVIAGMGCGLGCIAPVSTLVKWFPDRRGMATGMAIMGFGGGACLAGCRRAILLGVASRLYWPPDCLCYFRCHAGGLIPADP